MPDDSSPMPPPKVDTIYTHATDVTVRLLIEGMEVATGSGPTPGLALIQAKAHLSPEIQALFS